MYAPPVYIVAMSTQLKCSSCLTLVSPTQALRVPVISGFADRLGNGASTLTHLSPDNQILVDANYGRSVDAFCQPCAYKVSELIDEPAQRAASKLQDSPPLRLTADDQSALLRWALKTAALTVFTGPEHQHAGARILLSRIFHPPRRKYRKGGIIARTAPFTSATSANFFFISGSITFSVTSIALGETCISAYQADGRSADDLRNLYLDRTTEVVNYYGVRIGEDRTPVQFDPAQREFSDPSLFRDVVQDLRRIMSALG